MSNIIHSLDPRVNRLDLERTAENIENTSADSTTSHGITWEVFHLERKGKQAVHVGIVHADNVELAMVFAKETFGRRGKTANLWVVKTSDVYTFSEEDEEIFSTTPEKLHREPAFYKVRDRIEAYQKKNA